MIKTSKTTLNSGSKIVFFGNERLATGVSTEAPVLTDLIEAGYDVTAIVANYEMGCSRKTQTLEVQKISEEHNIPILFPDKPTRIKDQLINFHAEIAVLAAYGKIIPQSIIDVFPKGIVNIHPSLLPLHRGSTPIESVILAGEEKTGVSLMSLVSAMDAGPVYSQSEVELSGTETKQELADSLGSIGGSMLRELLPDILNDSVVALPQDADSATYDSLIQKSDGVIDWHKSAVQLEREIRAFSAWPGSRTEIAEKDVIITKAQTKPKKPGSAPGSVSVTDDNALLVQTSDGSLCIERLKPAGKREMSAKEFLLGYGNQIFTK
ncbi:MAG: methionyl-tRNA formyltransferase [Candidatus Saccharibacteria bacterium]|nr:methionyl-tRNA formyltransferase [Candidatus Saccharibacteria bacterium]